MLLKRLLPGLALVGTLALLSSKVFTSSRLHTSVPPIVAPAQSHVHPTTTSKVELRTMPPAGAQARGTSVSTLEIPLAVDGKVNPDAIPDAVAYRHFMSASAVPSEATPEQLRRRTAFLKRVRLSESDEAGYIQATQFVRDDIDRIQAQRVQFRGSLATATTEAALRSLQAEEASVFQQARNRLAIELSAEGAQRLHEYIRNQVKPRIRIHGSLPK
jgi:hypothetical protein